MNWEMLAAIGQLAAVFVGIPLLLKIAAVLSKGGRQSGEIARQNSQKKLLACELVF